MNTFYIAQNNNNFTIHFMEQYKLCLIQNKYTHYEVTQLLISQEDNVKFYFPDTYKEFFYQCRHLFHCSINFIEDNIYIKKHFLEMYDNQIIISKLINKPYYLIKRIS